MLLTCLDTSYINSPRDNKLGQVVRVKKGKHFPAWTHMQTIDSGCWLWGFIHYKQHAPCCVVLIMGKLCIFLWIQHCSKCLLVIIKKRGQVLLTMTEGKQSPTETIQSHGSPFWNQNHTAHYRREIIKLTQNDVQNSFFEEGGREGERDGGKKQTCH